MKRHAVVAALLAFVGCTSPTEPLRTPLVVLDLFPRPGAEWADVGRSCDDTAPAVELHWMLRSVVDDMNREDSDDQWAATARRTPGGLGGIVIIDGVPTVLLREPEKRESAIAALRASGRTDIPTTAPAMRVRWDFSQMFYWYRYLSQYVSVTMSDISEGSNRIFYGVADAQERADLERVLRRHGVPCRLVSVAIVEPIAPR